MPVDRTSLVFFDASSLFLAANTPLGGSAFLIEVCSRGYLVAVVSPDVLLEAERNIVDKGRLGAFHRFRELVALTPFLVTSAPPEHVVRAYEAVFVEDAHVIAAALGSQSAFLITVDQRFERRVRASGLSITALSPREFLQAVLPVRSGLRRAQLPVRRDLEPAAGCPSRRLAPDRDGQPVTN